MSLPHGRIAGRIASNIDQLLRLTVSFTYGKVTTDWYIKSVNNHQYVRTSSCHPYHWKNAIPYSQAFSLKRICSDTNSFDRRCNNLENG